MIGVDADAVQRVNGSADMCGIWESYSDEGHWTEQSDSFDQLHDPSCGRKWGFDEFSLW